MRSKRALPVVFRTAALVLVMSAAAQAQEAVTMYAEVSWLPDGPGETSGPSYWGDFEASGAVVDSGGAQYGPWYPTSSLEFYGSAGAIRIILDNNGRWFIESGTGVHACLQGSGSYNEMFYVIDDPWLGETHVIEFELTGTVSLIVNDPPEAFLTVAAAGSLTVSIDASGSRDSDGVILSYEWDFDGDGLYDLETTLPAIEYAYAGSGTYLVGVRVTDDRGGSDIASACVTVQAQEEKHAKGKGKRK